MTAKIGRNDPCSCGSGKKFKQCCGALGAVAQAAPQAASALFQAGLAHHQQGRFEQAFTLYQQVLQQQPAHADALHLAGVIYFQRGQHDAAIAHISRALAIQGSEHYWTNLGNVLTAQRKFSEAADCYRQALAILPKLPEALASLGNALCELDQAGEAAKLCRQALQQRPDFVVAHFNLGNALARQRKWEPAAASYRAALALQPTLAEGHLQLGNALRALGQLPAAIAAFQQALALRPDYLDAWRGLAPALRAQGQFEAAVQAWLQALRLDDRDVPTRLAFVDGIRDVHFHAPDALLRQFVTRALDESWARPGDLLTPVKSLIEYRPAFRAALARAQQAWPRLPAREALFDAGGLAGLAEDGLLQSLLGSVAINSIEFERLFTLVRALLLDDAIELASSAAATPAGSDLSSVFYCALARQCFINEYVYRCTDEESKKIGQLQQHLQARSSAGLPLPPSCIAALAAYLPLGSLPWMAALAGHGWPAPLAALFRQQVDEPAAESRSRDGIPQLTDIGNAVSQLVQQQYEANPYPRWISTPHKVEAVGVNALMRHLFPLSGYAPQPEKSRVDILLAGCGTGQHAIQTAQQFAGAEVRAIDLSLASLAYAKRKTEERAITNIHYAQADILQLGGLDKRFDVIESVGVLHHLAEPLVGWRILCELLRPGGLMCLGFYSELARREVVAARSHIASRGYAATPADIRRCRQDLMDDASRFRQFLASRDFYEMSGCRDLLLHVQEHRFTLPQLKAALADLGLVFLGFMLDAGVAAAYSAQYPDDPARINLDHWHQFEQAHPQTFARMYQFWVQKAS